MFRRSGVPLYFLRHKNFVCHIPIRVLRIWWDSNKLRSRKHAGKREMLDKAPLICYWERDKDERGDGEEENGRGDLAGLL